MPPYKYLATPHGLQRDQFHAEGQKEVSDENLFIQKETSEEEVNVLLYVLTITICDYW